MCAEAVGDNRKMEQMVFVEISEWSLEENP